MRQRRSFWISTTPLTVSPSMLVNRRTTALTSLFKRLMIWIKRTMSKLAELKYLSTKLSRTFSCLMSGPLPERSYFCLMKSQPERMGHLQQTLRKTSSHRTHSSNRLSSIQNEVCLEIMGSKTRESCTFLSEPN